MQSVKLNGLPSIVLVQCLTTYHVLTLRIQLPLLRNSFIFVLYGYHQAINTVFKKKLKCNKYIYLFTYLFIANAHIYIYIYIGSFGGLGVACQPLVSKFAGSNPAKPLDFQGEKILSTPSFGGEVKPSVSCHRFMACERSPNVRGSRNLGKITGQFLAHSSTFRCQDISRCCGHTGTWRRKWKCLTAGESNGKLPPRTCPGCSVPEPYRSHDWALVLPARPLRLNTNE